MSLPGVSLSVKTDRHQYLPGDNVMVIITAEKGEKPAAQEKLKLYIFRPDGNKLFTASLRTDDKGQAIALYRLKKKDETGNYYIEVQAQNHFLALSSFIVMA